MTELDDVLNNKGGLKHIDHTPGQPLTKADVDKAGDEGFGYDMDIPLTDPCTLCGGPMKVGDYVCYLDHCWRCEK